MALFRMPAFFTAALFALLLPACAQPTPYQYFRLGNPTPVAGTPRPGFALMGGGKDLDEAFRWLCDRAGGGDLLVLRATGDDDYNPYIQKLCHLNSVATVVIPSRAAANDPFVAQKIHEAGALFISGGDQSNYINFWMNSSIQVALNEAIHRGIPIGGTSAGLAVLGQYVYSAQGDKPDDPNLDSRTVLADSINFRIKLETDFISIPVLSRIITDTHFAKRDRMGRLLVFLAHLCAGLAGDHGVFPRPPGFPIRGIGVDERSAILLEPTGEARVIGTGRGAWFIDATEGHGTLGIEAPLNFGPYNVQHVASGQSFNLKLWQGDGTSYALQVDNGVVHSTQPNNSIY